MPISDAEPGLVLTQTRARSTSRSRRLEMADDVPVDFGAPTIAPLLMLIFTKSGVSERLRPWPATILQQGGDFAAGALQLLSASSTGEIFVTFDAAAKGVDLYLYYLSVYDPTNSSCNFVKDRPMFVDGALVHSHDSYQAGDSTEAAWYCVPESNIVKDPRFTTLGSDKGLWRVPNDLTYN
jgi:hypothetical protein